MPNVLSSWKEIAAYVGRSIRTVQRWERELGLPVHRPNGKTDGVVIALPAELDAWVKAMPTTSHFLNAEDGNGVHAAVHSDGNGNGKANGHADGSNGHGITTVSGKTRPVPKNGRAVPRLSA